ncbi:ABC-three component system middle component 2 [Pseudodesulfovibrio tunisiensis]|uniref:ABC-three component system middle component 2 n=1 Tax=Pseudodesulfovibrio tunisiensis TaxID=463192 RepID=UPI003C730732
MVMTKTTRPVVFNSPFEAGMRSLVVLNATYPNSIDLHRILQFEYLIVHSADIGGPESLHPPVPLRSGELLVRRGLIESGLQLMLSRGLIDRVLGENGIEYMATDSSEPFIRSLSSPYILKLVGRAEWVAETFMFYSQSEMSALMKMSFDRWTSEFHSIDQSSGLET